MARCFAIRWMPAVLHVRLNTLRMRHHDCPSPSSQVNPVHACANHRVKGYAPSLDRSFNPHKQCQLRKRPNAAISSHQRYSFLTFAMRHADWITRLSIPPVIEFRFLYFHLTKPSLNCADSFTNKLRPMTPHQELTHKVRQHLTTITYTQ